MPIPENFKYDVRVRERMLKRGLLTESELSKHVDALADVTDQGVEVELKEPARANESERGERGGTAGPLARSGLHDLRAVLEPLGSAASGRRSGSERCNERSRFADGAPNDRSFGADSREDPRESDGGRRANADAGALRPP